MLRLEKQASLLRAREGGAGLLIFPSWIDRARGNAEREREGTSVRGDGVERVKNERQGKIGRL